MKKILLALVAGATTFGAAHAHAQMSQMLQRPYVGIGVANSDRESNIAGATGDGWKASGKVFGGLQFDETFGAELGYTDFRESTIHYTIANVPGRVSAKGEAWYLAGKATAPLNDQFSIYGKLGLTRTKWEQTGAGSGNNLFRKDHDTEGYLAVGGEWRVTERVGVSLEYERYGKSKAFGPKPNVWSINANYRF
ncbi:MAG TPA: porin family protein [Telluria sp.]